MGKGLPSFDKEGMPGSDFGPRQGWLESARDCHSAAFPDHPVLDFVSAPPLIRGGEFKSLGFQGPEQLQRKKLLRPPLGTGIGIGNVIGIEFVIQFKALWLSHIVDADAESDPP